MKNKKWCALVAMWCVAGALPALAAYDLDPVVVTATRTALEMSKVPATVSVISGDSIRDKHYQTMDQVLRDEPGIYIGTYAPAGYTGSASFYINGSNKVVWMVDGVKMNLAGVNTPLQALRNMQNIDRVEVVKSSSSTLYGSDAVGGVVNVITKKDYEGVHGGVEVGAGNFGNEFYHYYANGGQDGWYWNVNYGKDISGDYKDAKGLKYTSHMNMDTLSFKVGKKLNENNDISISYDAFKTKEKYVGSNKQLDAVKYGTMKSKTWHGVWNSQFQPNLSNRLTWMTSDYSSNYSGWANRVKGTSIGDQLTWKPTEEHNVIFGFDWKEDKVVTSGNKKLTNTSFYAQDSWNFDPEWNLTLGLRYDHNNRFGNHKMPHASLTHHLDENTDVYLAYNTFFVAPTPYQIFSAKHGNAKLKAEKGYAWEAGLRHQFSENLVGSISAFRRNLKDRIVYVGTTEKGTYINLHEKSQGITMNLTQRMGDSWNLQAGYVFTHVDATNPGRTRNVDGYVPRHQVTLAAQYKKDKFDGAFTLKGIIDRPGPQTPDVLGKFFPKNTYWLADVSMNYQVRDNIRLFGRVNNLFNTYYVENSNARSSWWGKEDEWWTAPGRNYMVGMSLTF